VKSFEKDEVDKTRGRRDWLKHRQELDVRFSLTSFARSSDSRNRRHVSILAGEG